MDQVIIQPRAYRKRVSNLQQTIGGETGYPQGATAFVKGSILVLTAGLLVPVATAGVLAAGIAVDNSNSDTVAFPSNPPYDLFGLNHFPLDLHGLQFLINIGTLSGTAAVVGQANSAKQISDVAIGTTYGIARATTGTYAGYQFLDPTNTTQLLLTVVEIPSLRMVQQTSGAATQQTSTTYNGIVLVEIAGGLLQSLA